MWKLPHQDRVSNLSRQFEQVWDQEVKKPKPSLVRLPHLLIAQSAFMSSVETFTNQVTVARGHSSHAKTLQLHVVVSFS